MIYLRIFFSSWFFCFSWIKQYLDCYYNLIFFFKVFSVLVARRCQIIGWTAHVLIYHWFLLIAAHFVGNKLKVWLGFFELNSVIDQKRYQEGILEKGFNSLSKLSVVHYFYLSRSVIYLLLTGLLEFQSFLKSNLVLIRILCTL